MVRETPIAASPLRPYEEVFGPGRMAELRDAVGRLARRLGERTVWHVNTTAAGGGVAELLHAQAPLANALGLKVRWLVLDGDSELFGITKRLCLRLYGSAGDGGPLGPEETGVFERAAAVAARELAGRVRPGDVVILHDPQVAGLVQAAKDMGATVVWRCHIGCDEPNRHSRDGWAFLRPFVRPADAMVFSTARHVPEWADRTRIIAPSIDPCGPRNMPLGEAEVGAVLSGIGVTAGAGRLPFGVRTPGGRDITVRREAAVIREGSPPPATAPMVVQVSRWDRLKDMPGVMRAFVQAAETDAYLTLAGPDAEGVADDPEAGTIHEACHGEWSSLPAEWRRRVQLVSFPMADLAENAVMVNALQRHAAVVVQKSLAEGFGLTATEAMWKARPLLASDLGGLRDQVVDQVHGLTVTDPRDTAAAAEGIKRLLTDQGFAAALGRGARDRVTERFLLDRSLMEWSSLITDLLTGRIT